MSGFDARFWLDLAQWVTTLAIGVYVWLANHRRATRAHIKTVDAKHTDAIKGLGDRLILVEGTMQHFPTGGQFAELSMAQARAQGAIEAVDEKVKGIVEMMRSMESRLAMLTENELAEGRASKGRKK